MFKILDEFQKKVLKKIGESELIKSFIWSGGTALSYFYLKHRLSLDLDFLSQKFFPDEYLLIQINQIAKALKVKRIEEQKKFNRHEFWFKKNKKTLKLEFIFYPFSYIEKPKQIKEFNIKIDSIEDILTNKTHAIFERYEPKDVFDFYWIIKKEKINFFQVFKWVKKKFGVEIDPVIFIGQLLEGVDRLQKIRPHILEKRYYVPERMKQFFKTKSREYLKRKMK